MTRLAVALLVVVCGMLLGCEREEPEPVAAPSIVEGEDGARLEVEIERDDVDEAAERLEEGAQRTLDVARETFEEAKKNWEDTADNRLETFDARIARLEERGETLAGEDRVEFRNDLARIKGLRAELAARFDNLDDVTADNWGSFREGIDETLEDLDEAIEDVEEDLPPAPATAD